MTSFMIGNAVRRQPDVAAEIVRRGHEAGAHGRSWERQYQLPRPQKKEWIADSVQAIEQATSARPADVWWARKDQIAQWVLDHPDMAVWADRDPAPVSGLPGRSA
jgi:peptidoglycan/xylan/chitin deacetylase (PgdA/CDA1 family)